MRYLADLHVHSHFSMATSKRSSIPEYALSAARKGIRLVGTSDCLHPGHLLEIERYLEAAPQEGLYRLTVDSLSNLKIPSYQVGECREIRFILSVEVSTIYKKNGKVRKLHHLLLFPNLETARHYARYLDQRCNIRSDGRPILGLDSYQLLEAALKINPHIILIPAHIWTPHFSLFGAYSGFNTIEECFEDLTPYIYAVETGLSSDPSMNWRVKNLDRYFLLSNSDAHNPDNLGREANLMESELSYPGFYSALQGQDPLNQIVSTLEFFPEEGKYHYDGHRKCRISLDPMESIKLHTICPVCHKPLTTGVLHRVMELADRPPENRGSKSRPYTRLVSLLNLLSECWNKNPTNRHVQESYQNLLRHNGPELPLLMEMDPDHLITDNPLIKEAIRRMRRGDIHIEPGYDGEYGVIKVFDPAERNGLFKTSFATLGKEYGILSRNPGKNGRTKNFIISEQLAMGFAHQPAIFRHPKTISPEQQTIIQSPAPHILVQAGPGTGKTFTLIERIKNLIQQADWKQIMVVTFTEKAADEILSRLHLIIKPPYVGTFHSISLQVLKNQFHQQVYLLTQADQLYILKKNLKNVSCRLHAQSCLEKISSIKSNSGTDPVMGSDQVENRQIMSIYEAYQSYLHDHNLMDFDDLLLRSLHYIEQTPDFSVRHLVIDEIQDCNPLQYRWIKTLSRRAESMFLIGDYYQSIYQFRGARPDLILHLKSEYPDLQIHHLNTSYRLPWPIIRCGCEIISYKPIPLNLISAKPQCPAWISISEHPNSTIEKSYWAMRIKQMLGGMDMVTSETGGESGPQAPEDIAILFRTNGQLKEYARYFAEKGLPVCPLPDYNFLDDPVLKPVLYSLYKLAFPANPLIDQILEDEGLSAGAFEHLMDVDSIAVILQELLGYYQVEKSPELDWMESILTTTPKWKTNLQQMINRQPLVQIINGLRVMTMHSAKGLEFQTVILPAMEEDTRSSLQEDEHLLYVAVTRCKENLHLSYSRQREIHHQWVDRNPSRYINVFRPLAHFILNVPNNHKSRQMSLF